MVMRLIEPNEINLSMPRNMCQALSYHDKHTTRVKHPQFLKESISLYYGSERLTPPLHAGTVGLSQVEPHQ